MSAPQGNAAPLPNALPAAAAAASLGGGGGNSVGSQTEPFPVWLWMDYKDVPGYIELNLASLERNAPSPRFQIKLVTRDMLPSLVPDMPTEFDQLP